MFEPIYGLPAGYKIAAGGAGAGTSYWPTILGGGYVDAYRKDRAPSPRELIHELIGIAWACIALRADTIASATIRLYARKGTKKSKYIEAYKYRHGVAPTREVSRKQLAYFKLTGIGTVAAPHNGDVEEVTDHPILDLLNSPENIEGDYGLSGYDHRWMTQVFLDAMGRAYWYIQPGAMNVPSNLWILRSHFTKEVPDFTGKRIINYYEYGGTQGIRYTPDEIIKFRVPDPYAHHYNGYGPLQAAIEKLRLARRKDAQVNAILENVGFPGMIVSPKPDDAGNYIGSAEARRLQVAIDHQIRQAGAGSTFVMPAPMEIMFPTWKPAEILDVNQYDRIKTEILNVFGIPDTMLNRNDANRASAIGADVQFAARTQIPMQTRIESAMNRQLIPAFGDMAEGMFLAYDNPVPDDKAFELEQTTAGWQAGIVETDEFRIATGLTPYGDARGKRRYISVNAVPLDDQGLPITPDSIAPANAPGDAEKSVRAKMREAGYSDDEITERIAAARHNEL